MKLHGNSLSDRIINPGRRAFAPLMLALMFSACTTTTTSSTSRIASSERRRQTLRELGFVETSDGWELNLAVKLLFATDSAVLSPKGLAEIQRIAPILNDLGVQQFLVIGYTDNVGSDEYNRQLSHRRAETVSIAMKDHGLSDADFMVRGMGKANPVASNDSPDGRQENRRVAIIVVSI